jgi:hypothetical protein
LFPGKYFQVLYRNTIEAPDCQEILAERDETTLKHDCIPRVGFVWSGNMPCDRVLAPVLLAASPAKCIAGFPRAGLGL